MRRAFGLVFLVACTSAEPQTTQGPCAVGQSCIARAPDGWEGPLFLYDGKPEDAPACPASMPELREDTRRGFRSTPHTCPPCACSPASGGTCQIKFNGHSVMDCSDVTTGTNVSTTACTPFAGGATYLRFSTAYGGGACVPSIPSPVLPPITNDVLTRACGTSTAPPACREDRVCVADPEQPFFSKPCIRRAGNLACPGLPYTVRTASFASISDTRACKPCACGAATCAGGVTLYDGAGCTGASTSVAAPSACRAKGAALGFRFASADAVGTCAPSGGGPEGTVDGAEMVTYCCIP